MFKEIWAYRPKNPEANPEHQALFRNLVGICELNENIRRMELTRKIKF
jgi:hypothetical protein